MVEGELRSLAHDVSNWGRWGADDERGTLNLVTPEITQKALALAHGFELTHLDALGHSFFDGHVYNGRTVADILTADGLGFASISSAALGIVTRGVLLDPAEAAGVPFLGRHAGISSDDLEKCEEFEGVRMGEGDAI
jgi:Putative cyclase